MSSLDSSPLSGGSRPMPAAPAPLDSGIKRPPAASTEMTSWPFDRSARAISRPVAKETFRSALVPPIKTVIFN
jgi:hypothetical protein